MEIQTRSIDLPSEEHTRKFGAALALLLSADDVIGFIGPLGVGKSVLVRAILSALPNALNQTDHHIDIPSPTYTLVETYQKAIGPVSHFDLYRIEAEGDFEEIGLEEAMDQGLVLIEWADKAIERLGPSTLLLSLSPGKNHPRLTITGNRNWFDRLSIASFWSVLSGVAPLPVADRLNDTISQANRLEAKAMNNRENQRLQFLSSTPWAKAIRQPLTGDASTRSYERLALNDKTAIFMDVPQQAETPGCPPGASPEERRALGYNACARLAGARMAPFITIARTLNEAGLAAPAIYHVDGEAGFAVIEDLGDDLFARVLGNPKSDTNETEHALYQHAVDVLAMIAKTKIRPVDNDDYQLQIYDETAMLAETQLLTQWYIPVKTGTPTSVDFIADYRRSWQQVLAKLSPPMTMVLRDYHAENLLWLPRRSGNRKTGLIDFQDALWGHVGYDLVSLLEDARRDVSSHLAAHMIEYYIDALGLKSDARADFLRDYAILGAQRNAKILGIFARLAERDKKTRYLDLLPRVEAHFRRNLDHPDLAEISALLLPIVPALRS